MAVRWGPTEHAAVAAILQKHPVDSRRCADAAREILPVAHDVDSQARARILRPTEGRYLATHSMAGRRWRHHVSVALMQHLVDALTGVDGTEEDRYLNQYFQFPDAVAWEDTDLGDDSL